MAREAEARRTSVAAPKFGTDGWRGVIADDFTVENLRIVTQAVAAYVLAHEPAPAGVVVGYDMRFGSERFGRVAADELARRGLRVWLASDHTPTPALSFAVRHHHASAGVMITASHNPWEWNGFKVKARYGGSASPAIIGEIEKLLYEDVPERAGGEVREVDMKAPYLGHIARLADLKKIASAGFRFALDPMYGSGLGYLPALFDEHSIRYTELHGYRDPLFPGLNPEPIEPHVEALRRKVVGNGWDAGFAVDGDADRLGAVDRCGDFVDSHRIFSILLQYLVEGRGWRGEVAKTFSTTKMIDRIAAAFRLPLHETPIGFKYICDLMLDRDILIGGEESGGIGVKGHLPERDGILNSLLLAEVMAHHQKSLSELVAGLHARYGPQHYQRVDLHLPMGQKERAVNLLTRERPASIAGYAVTGVEALDGIKFLMEPNSWVLIRASGTEPLLRAYAEAPSVEAVDAILAEVKEIVLSA